MTDQRYSDDTSAVGPGRSPQGSPQPPAWYSAAVPLLLALLAGVMAIAGS